MQTPAPLHPENGPRNRKTLACGSSNLAALGYVPTGQPPAQASLCRRGQEDVGARQAHVGTEGARLTPLLNAPPPLHPPPFAGAASSESFSFSLSPDLLRTALRKASPCDPPRKIGKGPWAGCSAASMDQSPSLGAPAPPHHPLSSRPALCHVGKGLPSSLGLAGSRSHSDLLRLGGT